MHLRQGKRSVRTQTKSSHPERMGYLHNVSKGALPQLKANKSVYYIPSADPVKEGTVKVFAKKAVYRNCKKSMGNRNEMCQKCSAYTLCHKLITTRSSRMR
jgi:hypothetical protein